MTTNTRIIRNTTTPAREGQVKHQRGMHARVILRDGRSYTGNIDGWGKQIMTIRPTDGGQHGWKVESHWVGSIDRVELVEG